MIKLFNYTLPILDAPLFHTYNYLLGKNHPDKSWCLDCQKPLLTQLYIIYTILRNKNSWFCHESQCLCVYILAMITTFQFFRVVVKSVNTELTLALPQLKKTAKIDQSGSQLSLVKHWVSQKYGYTPLHL